MTQENGTNLTEVLRNIESELAIPPAQPISDYVALPNVEKIKRGSEIQQDIIREAFAATGRALLKVITDLEHELTQKRLDVEDCIKNMDEVADHFAVHLGGLFDGLTGVAVSIVDLQAKVKALQPPPTPPMPPAQANGQTAS